MAAGLRLLIVACLAGFAASYVRQKCGNADWGRKNAEFARLGQVKTVGHGQHRAVFDFSVPEIGCDLIGAEAIACDDKEVPTVSFLGDHQVLIRRQNVLSDAKVLVITFCEPVIPYDNVRPEFNQHAPLYNGLPLIMAQDSSTREPLPLWHGK